MRPTYYLHEGVLSPEDCNVIIAEGSAKAMPAGLGVADRAVKRPLVRRSKAHFFHSDAEQPEELKAALQKVANVFWGVSRDCFGQSLDHIEPIQYASYTGPYGHYAWHYDVATEGNHRVVSASVELSDSASYLGGGLEIKKLPAAQKPKQGTMTTFPSLMLHRAKPVLWGTRHALILWGLVQEPANVARGT